VKRRTAEELKGNTACAVRGGGGGDGVEGDDDDANRPKSGGKAQDGAQGDLVARAGDAKRRQRALLARGGDLEGRALLRSA
jgi:hypothetical protein